MFPERKAYKSESAYDLGRTYTKLRNVFAWKTSLWFLIMGWLPLAPSAFWGSRLLVRMMGETVLRQTAVTA